MRGASISKPPSFHFDLLYLGTTWDLFVFNKERLLKPKHWRTIAGGRHSLHKANGTTGATI